MLEQNQKTKPDQAGINSYARRGRGFEITLIFNLTLIARDPLISLKHLMLIEYHNTIKYSVKSLA